MICLFFLNSPITEDLSCFFPLILSFSLSRFCSNLSISPLSAWFKVLSSSIYLFIVRSCSSISILIDVICSYVSLSFSFIVCSLFLVREISLLKLFTSVKLGLIFSRSVSFLKISVSWSFLSECVSYKLFQPPIMKSSSSSSCGKLRVCQLLPLP